MDEGLFFIYQEFKETSEGKAIHLKLLNLRSANVVRISTQYKVKRGVVI